MKEQKKRLERGLLFLAEAEKLNRRINRAGLVRAIRDWDYTSPNWKLYLEVRELANKAKDMLEENKNMKAIHSLDCKGHKS